MNDEATCLVVPFLDGRAAFYNCPECRCAFGAPTTWENARRQAADHDARYHPASSGPSGRNQAAMSEDAEAQAEYERRQVEIDDLPTLRVTLDQITAWPWYHSPNDSVISWSARPATDGPTMIAGRGIADDGQTELLVVPDGIDAQFIAAAPQMIADLIDLVEHYKARFDHARERLFPTDLLCAACQKPLHNGCACRAYSSGSSS